MEGALVVGADNVQVERKIVIMMARVKRRHHGQVLASLFPCNFD